MILKNSILIVSLLLAGCSTPPKVLCPDTRFANETSFERDSYDELTMKAAKKRCMVITGRPCLKLLIKRGKRIFYAECGDP